ncbi:hypothetical protein TPHA_0J00740 [Tetrapisispora phaffii CBS 4417]|uniref:Uncharacterized protein n=1 Tax=Tetrapisispora phaffii (strain ATCC 24235 / CBS 4417 / NBRC 1672 / NRRL Y-8282 / UCD 70-5) TaxID=1071381 RepID=G8BYF5_TETPH|nr:hypothetical protein TPHA_0J00740 [Tetrapisispora phaffii CBS 4417]CCE64897.1 hypothetical protein TPHA_0J00740 [Tetrapisispora phaffii CBS 4417]
MKTLKRKHDMIDDSNNDRIIKVDIPELDILYKIELGSDIDIERINHGRNDHLQLESVFSSFLTQKMYTLIREKNFNYETFEEAMKSHYTDSGKYMGTANKKFMLMEDRYQLNELGQITDKRNDYKLIVPPNQIYDLIMHCHFLNDHLGSTKIHHSLREKYSNISRALVRLSLQNCSHCNPKSTYKHIEYTRHFSCDKNFAFEKIHVEIFQPFEDVDTFANKFSHVIYIRDYFTRYVWLYPLEKISVKELANTLATHLLLSLRIPIYIESLTLDESNLLKILKRISKTTNLILGVGTTKLDEFQASGINHMKELFVQNREYCGNNWNKYVIRCQNHYNTTYNKWIYGIPLNLMAQETLADNKTYKKKRQRTILLTLSKNTILLKNGKSALYKESTENSIDLHIENRYEE